MDQHAKAAAFRRMHLEPPLLVLPNAWDVASAKALATLPGCRALATTSSAVARSLGWEDGERAPRDEMVEAARRIAAAVDVPVSADLERGYGDPVGTARAAWDAGLVGINFEDSTRAGLVPLDEQTAAIRAIRRRCRSSSSMPAWMCSFASAVMWTKPSNGRTPTSKPAPTAPTRSCARPSRSRSSRGASTGR